MNIDAYLDEQYKIFEYLMKQKQNGRIRHLGFSAHGSYDIMRRFLEKYGESMEFCQIQLNYIDWTFQNAKSKIELLNQYHIPVWVMEPLRGGKIANLTKQDIQKLNTYRENTSAVEWAFRFLQTLPEVTMILSGMSNLEQLKQNIETFQTEKTLQKNEMDALLAIADGILNGKLPCTSCRYCTSHCPQQLDIPRLLELYNEHTFTGGGFIAPMVMATIPKEKQPSACVGCRSCEAVCPQQIKISEAMSDFASKLNG
jgi:predicted aldo/keto reductase-like oxidoreductase